MNILPRRVLLATLAAASLSFTHAADIPTSKAAPRVFTAAGFPTDDTFFPIAVWLQEPRNAAKYQAAGINLYIGLWKGPDAAQLAELEKAHMPVICEQNAFALTQRDNPIIAAWMHGDEPDNAQELGHGKGYGPPIAPEKIVADYEHLRAADPSRPVILNLGQSVAWDNYIGRGVRRNHPEDYPAYLRGCDIASFDIYPVAHDNREIAGHLEYVPRGVERLIGWSQGAKPIWNCLECTNIGGTGKATPAQVRAEAWMALIRGSRGLVYFVHQFKPKFREAALFDDPEMLAAVTALNREIHDLAPVLNSPTIAGSVEIQSAQSSTAIATMLKRHGGETWLFTANLQNTPTQAAFTVKGAPAAGPAEVLGENRTLPFTKGQLSDDFAAYAIHLYRIGSDEK